MVGVLRRPGVFVEVRDMGPLWVQRGDGAFHGACIWDGLRANRVLGWDGNGEKENMGWLIRRTNHQCGIHFPPSEKHS